MKRGYTVHSKSTSDRTHDKRSPAKAKQAGRLPNPRKRDHPDIGVPLCVDLDGTLIRTDLLLESLFGLLRRNFGYLFLIPFWLLRGKARLKDEIAQRVNLDVNLLPYNKSFLEYLQAEHRSGRHLCLATASHRKFATKVAAHIGIFSNVLATTADENLSRERKLARLLHEFGERGFDYAGNSRADLKLVPHARAVILVNPELGVTWAAARTGTVIRTFIDRKASLKTYAKALRLHQWVKNLLVFVPLVADHRIGDFVLLIQAGIAFVVFGVCASSVYMLNDLLDLAADRKHSRKRKRPFAAGTLSLKLGALLAPLLLLLAFAVSLLFLPLLFSAALGVYYVVTLAYSFWLKGKMMVDIIVLAGLYTLRIIAGGAAVAIMPSFWLLALSMFLFLSLAMVKRYSELIEQSNAEKSRVAGRGYVADDHAQLSSLGAASGYAAVMVLALYINSPDGALQYRYPMAIWFLCPLLLYWISRVWVMAGRGKMHDDPIVFAIRDRVSRLVALVGVAIMWVAA